MAVGGEQLFLSVPKLDTATGGKFRSLDCAPRHDVERRRNDFTQVITWGSPTFGEKRNDFVSLFDAQHQAEPLLVYCQWVTPAGLLTNGMEPQTRKRNSFRTGVRIIRGPFANTVFPPFKPPRHASEIISFASLDKPAK